MTTNIIYQDKLVEITNDSILLKNYYFPSQKPKEILFDSIKKVEVKLPSLATGKWRFQIYSYQKDYFRPTLVNKSATLYPKIEIKSIKQFKMF